MIVSFWTDKLIEELTSLWAQGYSARLISEKLNCTRNAVIGKMGRLKLPSRELKETAGKQPKQKKTASKNRRLITRIVSANGNSNALRIVSSTEVAQYNLRCVEIVPRHLSLIDLEANDCRYPYGDGPMTFCGHPKQAGSSYCTPHFHLCRQEPYARRAAA